MVGKGRQCGVDLRLRPGQRERAGAVGSRADRGATGKTHIQLAVGDSQLGRRKIAVRVVHADRGDAAERQQGILVHRLGTRHGVDRSVGDRVDRDEDRFSQGIDAAVGGATAVLDAVAERGAAVGVGRRLELHALDLGQAVRGVGRHRRGSVGEIDRAKRCRRHGRHGVGQGLRGFVPPATRPVSHGAEPEAGDCGIFVDRQARHRTGGTYRRIIDGEHDDVDDVGGGRIRLAPADSAGIDFRTRGVACLVPGPEGQGGGNIDVVVRVRPEIQAGLRVVGQQQRVGRADRAVELVDPGPRSPAIDRVVPLAVRFICASDCNAF